VDIKKAILLVTIIGVAAAAGEIYAGTPCAGVNFKTTRIDSLTTPIIRPYFVDLDNDGIKDLIGASNNGTAFTFYKGSANGFNTPPVITNDGGQYTLQYGDNLFADFNGDGRLDMVAQKWPSPWWLAIYLNNGNGSFLPARPSRRRAAYHLKIPNLLSPLSISMATAGPTCYQQVVLLAAMACT
jgi:FG-GAP-like repeat